jgi:putative FmdB family regulatory protein
MPIFDFRCGCGCVFEDLVGSSVYVATCPQCKSESATRAVPAPRWSWGSGCNPEADTVKARQREWIQTPDIQAKLKSGELVLGGNS